MMQINCPVCSYQDITGDTCPNCDADLRVIRMLQALPQVPTQSPWPLRIALLLLIIAIGLGVATNLIFSRPQLNTVVITQPSPVTPQKPPEPTTYTVQTGDNLSAIAQKLCGQGVSLPAIVQANPQLIGRENYLEVGQVLKIPQCQEGVQ
ncbi:LysM peptidoglycan-binding domain-containing protein [Nostoc parmelioides]|uniref:LysM peptidoglycan-binding domain-containing protein n=1 Tax=Nostoc parmelioides FACHB-3921 TaxID=2692909 RepID=A0ABR8BBY3_9NOSO|nr:LysM peptidoglycan-binding domain-containing protein [Nostoc parmelioides]MBD2251435.1 LysM peptidoglycan-binding domain-containing protein [Nostoc parmelioides FACHB-3921]